MSRAKSKATGKHLRLWMLLILSLGAGAAFAALNHLAAQPARKVSKMQPEKVVAEIKQSLFLLVATDFNLPLDAPRPWCSGTGFLVNDEGNLVTNAHVVRNAETQCRVDHERNRLTAQFWDESRETRNGHPVDLVAIDEQRDIAVLRIATWESLRKKVPELRSVVFRTGSILDGAPVGFTGYPFLHPVPLSQFGVVSGQVNDRFVALGPIVRTMVVNQPSNSGSSGSPLYLIESGEVIGVVNANKSVALRTLDGQAINLFQHSGFSIAISSEHIVKFLAEHHVNHHVVGNAE